MNTKLVFLAAAAAAVVGLSGCASGVKLNEAPVTSAAPAASNTGAAQPGQVATVDVTKKEEPGNGPAGVGKSVYFDYDAYVIKDEYKPLVDAQAKYLMSHTNKHVALEGNADERGSREYNLALGQKRADAVRRALALLGVNDAQMEAVSFGKEKPRNPGHDEAAWAENRRVDFNYR